MDRLLVGGRRGDAKIVSHSDFTVSACLQCVLRKSFALILWDMQAASAYSAWEIVAVTFSLQLMTHLQYQYEWAVATGNSAVHRGSGMIEHQGIGDWA